MRAAIPLAIVVLLSAVAPPTLSAQEGAAPAHLLEDPAGDVALEPSGAVGALPSAGVPANQQTDAVDLVALDVAEDLTRLTFTTRVTNLEGSRTWGAVHTYFAWEGARYRISMFPMALASPDGPSMRASLYAYNGDYFTYLGPVDSVIDASAGVLSATVPKPWIVNGDGRIPSQGDALADLFVEATSQAGSIVIASASLSPRVADRMPDSAAGEYVVQAGTTTNGHLVFEVEEPVRVSNGGATTIVFEAMLSNMADFEDEVRLNVTSVPPGWNVKVDTPQRIPADDRKPVHVLATIPFGHQHGGFDTFTLVARSGTMVTEATADFGVAHTLVPMPAGHHPDLFLHLPKEQDMIFQTFRDTFPFDNPFMSTSSDHEGDMESVASTDFRGNGAEWRIPLGPAMGMGLDFDLERTGTLVGKVLGRTAGEGVMSARLWYGTDDEEKVALAESDGATVTLDANAATPFAITLKPTKDSDYVPYDRASNLWLVVTLDTETVSGCCARPAVPSLTIADFQLTLPLNEYHDRLPAAASSRGLIELTAEGALEREAAPGSVVAYAFSLKNTADKEDRFVVDVAGTDSAAGKAAPLREFVLKAGESTKVALAVTVPQESAEGDTLEVLLLARSVTDPSRSAIARTKTIVSLDTDAADEGELLEAAQNEARESPGAGALAALAAAGAVAVALRGRRR